MKRIVVSLGIALVVVVDLSSGFAADMKDKVKVEIESVGLHPGMDPGMYVCASGHLHIKASVENLSGATLGRIKVAGKAFGPEGRLFGEATASTKQTSLAPGEKAPVDLEFLTIGGPLIRQVKSHEVKVIDAPAK